MTIKKIKPINFLFFKTETTVHELAKFLPVGQQLFKEAVENNLSITGPVHWHYFGFSGDETKPFQLEIALPVGEVPSDYDGNFHFKRTDEFRCVSVIHDGGWLEIPTTYGKAFAFIQEQKLKPVLHNREVYVNVDFRNPEANVTEIQIGIE